MAKKPTTTKNLDSDVAKELEEALDFDLTGGGGDLDIAASMEDLEAQISQAADELARESASDKAGRQAAQPTGRAAPQTAPEPTSPTHGPPTNGARSPPNRPAAACRPFAGQ